MEALQQYAWPGNSSELYSCIEHLLVLVDKPLIELGDLPAHVTGVAAEKRSETPKPSMVVDTGNLDGILSAMTLESLRIVRLPQL